ncbi:MAG: hypothetical protein ACKVU4_08055 [Phycisphaerales bacterium]
MLHRRAASASLAALLALTAAEGAAAQWSLSGLNAYYNAGNVGIGTAAPGSKLHVVTTASANGTRAINAVATAITGVTTGIAGESRSPSGRGLFGVVTAVTGATSGVLGQVASTAGRGVSGVATAVTGATNGVFGQVASTTGRGVYGLSLATTGINFGVYGESRSNVPATGLPVVTNLPAGVYGRATSATARAIGVLGHNSSPGGAGVAGYSTSASGENSGVYGEARGATTAGVTGINLATTGFSFGVQGDAFSPVGAGVYGHGSATTTENYGVYGETDSLTNGWGVFAEGNLGASGLKTFHIDHPTDPANKYLNHFCAEGPEPLLIYRGNATLDGTGASWVDLPAYFEALNRDFHYALTPIGAPGPLLHVAEEVSGNRFRIAGGTPGGKVSWTVTGVRNDAYTQSHLKPVEEDKTAEHRGRYLHPHLFGQPESKSIRDRAAAAHQ